MSEKIMSVGEIAKYLGFSTKKIYRLAEEGKIPASRVGRQYRFVKSLIDDWLQEMALASLSNGASSTARESRK
jgi:excisionase family DNA binding protein